MPLIPLEFPQGVHARGTTYSEGARVVEANLIRWLGSNIVPVGGWQFLLNSPLLGTIRSFFTWTATNGTRWLGIGATNAVYAYDGNAIHIISPMDWVESAEFPVTLAGYGTGLHSTGDYSDPVGEDPSEGGPLTAVDYGVVQFANWGENLLFCSVADGRLIEWNPNTPTVRGVVVANAPTRIRTLAVTPERHVVVTGAYNGSVEFPRRASWCSQENNTEWTPTPINTAGDLEVSSQADPIRQLSFRNETLIFTASSLHRIRYLGPPYVYAIDTIAVDCGLICPQAVAQSAERVFWLSRRGFFVYDGGRVTPIQTPLTDRFRGISLGDIANATVVVGHNEQFNEFWCFYPELPGNPTRYVSWNYLEDWWAEGALSRTAWADNFVGSNPVAASLFSMYRHEAGVGRADYFGAPYLQSGPIELGQGDAFVAVQRIIPDVEFAQSPLNFMLRFSDYPQGQVLKTVNGVLAGPKVDLRGVGRSADIRIGEAEGSPGGAWVLGKCRIEVQPGESR